MHIPPPVQALIDEARQHVRADPAHDLDPRRRLTIYDAFGPQAINTAESLSQGKLFQTTGDRIRARASLLTARHVLALWERSSATTSLFAAENVGDFAADTLSAKVKDHMRMGPQRLQLLRLLRRRPFPHEQALQELAALDADLLPEQIRRAMLDLLNSSAPATGTAPKTLSQPMLRPWERSISDVPPPLLPRHLVELAEGVLTGGADIAHAVEQALEVADWIGNNFGLDDDEAPAQAFAIISAAYEALSFALAWGPYQQLGLGVRSLFGDDAIVSAAARAYACIFDARRLAGYNPARGAAFWEWWLGEAIPTAWSMTAERADPAKTQRFFST